MEIQLPTPEQIERANAAFQRFVKSLAARQGTDKPAVGFSASQEFAAAFIESGAAEQKEIQISDVFITFAERAISFTLRLKIPGKAWPPRPPIDTRVSMKVAELEIVDKSGGSATAFVVEEPLAFSSMFADMLLALVGKFAHRLPVNISELRTKGARVHINFIELVKAVRPELSLSATQIKLQKLHISPGHALVELGFTA